MTIQIGDRVRFHGFSSEGQDLSLHPGLVAETLVIDGKNFLWLEYDLPRLRGKYALEESCVPWVAEYSKDKYMEIFL